MSTATRRLTDFHAHKDYADTQPQLQIMTINISQERRIKLNSAEADRRQTQNTF